MSSSSLSDGKNARRGQKRKKESTSRSSSSRLLFLLLSSSNDLKKKKKKKKTKRVLFSSYRFCSNAQTSRKSNPEERERKDTIQKKSKNPKLRNPKEKKFARLFFFASLLFEIFFFVQKKVGLLLPFDRSSSHIRERLCSNDDGPPVVYTLALRPRSLPPPKRHSLKKQRLFFFFRTTTMRQTRAREREF